MSTTSQLLISALFAVHTVFGKNPVKATRRMFMKDDIPPNQLEYIRRMPSQAETIFNSFFIIKMKPNGINNYFGAAASQIGSQKFDKKLTATFQFEVENSDNEKVSKWYIDPKNKKISKIPEPTVTLKLKDSDFFQLLTNPGVAGQLWMAQKLEYIGDMQKLRDLGSVMERFNVDINQIKLKPNSINIFFGVLASQIGSQTFDEELTATIQFEVENSDNEKVSKWVIDPGNKQIIKLPEEPTVTLKLNDIDFVKLLSKLTNFNELDKTGKLELSGDKRELSNLISVMERFKVDPNQIFSVESKFAKL